MSSRCMPLKVPLKETKNLDEERVAFFFKKDKHAKLLLENLVEMQANEGLMTDTSLRTGEGEHEEKFHSFLLAACSPVMKQHLTRERNSGIVVKEMTKELLESFRDFLYKSEVILNRKTVAALQEFASKYFIDSLGRLCETFEDQLEDVEEMHVFWRDQGDVLSEMYVMFREEELATVLLEDAKGKTQIAVHGPLIAAASPVLQEILNEPPSQGTVKYRLNVPSAILRDLIKYIYSAEVTLESDNVFGLLKAASTYEMPALARVCCHWLISRLNDGDDAVDNLCLVRELGSYDFTKDLEEAAKRYILANFTKMTKGEELNELYYEDLLEIIADERLNVQSEEDVFFAAIKWVESSESDRLPFLCDLLKCVRLELTNVAFLDEAKRDSRIGKCSQCIKVIQDARERLSTENEARKPDVCKPKEGNKIFQTEIPQWRPRYFDDPNKETAHKMLSAEGSIFCKKQEELGSSESSTESLDPCSSENGQQRKQLLRIAGRPDMCYRKSRELYLKKGLNKNGASDGKLKESKDVHGEKGIVIKECIGSPKKDGTPDIPANNGALGSSPLQGNTTSFSDQMRDKNVETKVEGFGPLARGSKPDKRFQSTKESPRRTGFNESSPRKTCQIPGLIKKNGTPVNKQSNISSLATHGACLAWMDPVKKDGSPDTRCTLNKQCYAQSSSNTTNDKKSSVACDDKKGGTLDMRPKANRR